MDGSSYEPACVHLRSEVPAYSSKWKNDMLKDSEVASVATVCSRVGCEAPGLAYIVWAASGRNI